MITQINLEYFKCFEKLKLPIAPLTLLSGTNASGKSTVIQSLVLLHQTMVEHEWSVNLQLNGSKLNLGSFADVVDQEFGRSEFKIRIEDLLGYVEWKFSASDDKQALSVPVTLVNVNNRQIISTTPEMRNLMSTIPGVAILFSD